MSSEDREILFDPPRETPLRSEEDLFASLSRPQGKTSYKDVYEYDQDEQRVKRRAKDLNSPELNLTDSTTAILVGGNATYQFTWHTATLINQFVHLQSSNPGYDLSDIIRFLYDNYTTNLNLSKAVEGALLKAMTTKELKQITENRNITSPSEEPDAIAKWWNRKTNKARN